MKISQILLILLFMFSQAVWALDNKVLLIGVDGVQYERVIAIDTPALDRLNLQKAYGGGITGTLTQQQTSSGASWSTILTGVWANKHQVVSNGSGLASDAYPSLYRRIRTAYPEAYIASFSTWAPIHTQFFANDLDLMNEKNAGGGDVFNLNRAIALLENTSVTPDFIFLHLDEPDGVGHARCFGEEYDNSIRTADQRIAQLLDRVDVRRQQGENWLVVVTTDHGRTPGTGCDHGGQSQSEKTIFIAASESMNEEFNTVVTDLPNNSFNNLYGYPAQTSITPTLMRYMGIEPQVSDQLDGIPLLGELGVRKLFASNGVLGWFSTDQEFANIYRNTVQVDQVPANQGQWVDPQDIGGLVDYVVELNQTPLAVQEGRIGLRAIHGWDNAKSYFFRNDAKYVRYNEILDRADEGYPSLITDGNWPGLGAYRDLIVAAFKASQSTVYYFLKDGRYISYDIQEDRARDGYPREINNLSWPGMAPYAQQIVATLRWKDDKVYFFLDNGQYLRYDLAEDRLDEGYPAPINDSNWPGLGAYGNQIIASVKWNSTKAYFFLKDGSYIRYSISFDRADSGYPRPVNNDTWPGLLAP